jgi:hypothetical protein
MDNSGEAAGSNRTDAELTGAPKRFCTLLWTGLPLPKSGKYGVNGSFYARNLSNDSPDPA